MFIDLDYELETDELNFDDEFGFMLEEDIDMDITPESRAMHEIEFDD